MARKEEIERKFLIHRDQLPALPAGKRLVQGYLAEMPTVRVRTEEDCQSTARRAFLTIKGKGLVGRDEFEYEIPFEEAEALLKLARGFLISKTRYCLPVEGFSELAWELDVFNDENDGLIVVEIELPSAGHPYPTPDWLGEEVSEDPAYKNAALAKRPFNEW